MTLSKENLYSYQNDGVEFLTTKKAGLDFWPHALLADEPGLGKTPQSIIAAIEVGAKHILVTCLATIKLTWARQLVDWGYCRADQIFIVWSSNDKIPKSAKVVIVNYELVIKQQIQDQLLKRWFDVWIGDEAHRMKSMQAKTTKVMLAGYRGRKAIASRCYWKWVLTGSFMENRIVETYPIIKALAPMVLGEYSDFSKFARYFCAAEPDGYGGLVATGSDHIPEYREMLKPFMLRREFKEVYDIPPLIHQNVYLKIDKPSVMGFDLAQYLLDGVGICLVDADESNTPQARIYRLIGEAKIPAVLAYLIEWIENNPGEKVCVLAYHRKVIEELTEGLKKYNPVKIYGGMSSKEKDAAIQQYCDTPDSIPLIGQITSIGTGVDGIQKVCNNLVFAENDWSAGKDLQGIGRLHRLLQTKPVYVTRLIAEGTIDDAISGTVRSKKKLIKELYKKDKRMSLEESVLKLVEAVKEISTSLKDIAANGGGGFVAPKSATTPATDAPSKTVTATSATSTKPAAGKPAKEEKKAAAKPAAGKKVKASTHDDIVALAKEIIAQYEEESEGKAAVNDKVDETCGGVRTKLREVPADKIEEVVAVLKQELEDLSSGADESEDAEDDDFS